MKALPYGGNQENLLDYIALCALCLGLTEGGGEGDAPARAAAWREAVECREAATPPHITLTLPALKRALQLDDCSCFCVLFAVCCELDGPLRTQVQARCSGSAPTFDLVFSLYSLLYRVSLDTLFALPSPYAGPLGLALRLDEGFQGEQPLLAAPLLLRRNILHFLVCGEAAPNPQYRLAEPPPPEALALHRDALRGAEEYLSDVPSGASGLYFRLAGAAGSGRRTLLRRLAAEKNIPFFFLDCGPLGTLGAEQLFPLSRQLAGDLLLTGAALCLTDFSPDLIRQVNVLLRALPPGVPLFLICTEENPPPFPLCGRLPLVHSVPPLSVEEYGAAWTRFRGLYPTARETERGLPAYRLNIGQMEQVWTLAAHFCRGAGRGEVDRRDLAAAVGQLNAPVGCAVGMRSDVTLDDMVLGEETRARLELICHFARCRQSVLEEGGFAPRLPYGRGVTALLCGASGTGKTMAAAAIANELGLELLRLDLSQIFDKYIGETEKKLAAVFTAASKGNYILFFDEADALFSKRTEISSSHDRYANVETSFLLQSMEQYDGIVLLSTNLFRNFDEAFLRRINVIARFPMPDAEQRLALWTSVFPSETALASGLDWALLARELELSPAVIKNAALSAAVLACAQGKPVGMPQLLFALRNELEKCGQESQLTALALLFGENAGGSAG